MKHILLSIFLVAILATLFLMSSCKLKAAAPIVTVTCWDGSEAEGLSSCPDKVTCWDGSFVTNAASCKPEPIKCWDGSMAETQAACPLTPAPRPAPILAPAPRPAPIPAPVERFMCWDGSVVEVLSLCPVAPAPPPAPVGIVMPPPPPPPVADPTLHILKPKGPFTWTLDSQNSLPYFNPPPTTVKEDIDNNYFTVTDGGRSRKPNLREVFEKITSVLSSHVSLDYGYRVFKYEKGFAILTDPERIHNDGAIKLDGDGERADLLQQNATNFREYIEAFLRPPENRIRYIAFIVTSNRHIEATSASGTQEMLDITYQSGGTRRSLPLDLLTQYEFDNSYRVQVRVYEFPMMPQVQAVETGENVMAAGLIQETQSLELSTYDPSKFTPLKFRHHTSGSFALNEIFKPQ